VTFLFFNSHIYYINQPKFNKMDKLNFSDTITSFVDNLVPGLGKVILALAILIIGMWLAKLVRKLIEKGLAKTDVDNKIFKGATGGVSVEKFVSKIIYYLIVIIVLMSTLEVAGMTTALEPLKDMVKQFTGAIPKILLAGIVGYAGYLIAKIVSELVESGSGQIEKWSAKAGIQNGGLDLSKILKNVVFILISISGPATDMLNQFTSAIPNIIVAGIIIAVTYIVANFLKPLAVDLLEGLGADTIPSKLGSSNFSAFGSSSVSKLLGNLLFFFLMFFGVLTAVDKLGFAPLSNILNEVLALSGNIAFGLVIMAVGGFIANLAYKALSKGDDDFLGSVARVAVLGLFLAISLKRMGLADSIVNLAFGLILGAVAVAIALSFGLGGREAAGKQMDHILSKFRKK